VHVDNYARFTGPTQFEAPPLLSLKVTIHDTHEFDVVSLPLLITSATNAPPYALTIVAEDTSGQYKSLVLDECRIVYPYSSESPGVKSPLVVLFEATEGGSEARLEFKQGVGYASNFRLVVRGYYEMRDGTTQPFAGESEFKANKTRGLQNSLVVLNGV
jgi:hypothetical protein